MRARAIWLTLILGGCVSGRLATDKWGAIPVKEADKSGDTLKVLEAQAGAYRARFSYDLKEFFGSFSISRGDRELYLDSGTAFRYEPVYAKDSKALHDLDGDGTADLLVQSYSGGAHCCYSYTVFSLGGKVKKAAILEARNSPFILEDVDGDGRLEARGTDDTFAYWEASYAQSPKPKVIVRLKGGRFELARNLMKKPPISGIAMADEVKKYRQILEDEQTFVPAWWGRILEFIYSGQGEQAWRFLDLTWPMRQEKKEEFKQAFQKQLAQSQWWEELKVLNGWD